MTSKTTGRGKLFQPDGLFADQGDEGLYDRGVYAEGVAVGFVGAEAVGAAVFLDVDADEAGSRGGFEGCADERNHAALGRVEADSDGAAAVGLAAAITVGGVG